MCDRISLINQGQVVLDGQVDEVRRRFGGNTVEVSGNGPIGDLPGVSYAENHKNNGYHISLEEGITPQQFLRTLAKDESVTVDHFSIALPTLHDIFIQIVGAKEA
jgi:ABC-2 type transport system ATP-binding protein